MAPRSERELPDEELEAACRPPLWRWPIRAVGLAGMFAPLAQLEPTRAFGWCVLLPACAAFTMLDGFLLLYLPRKRFLDERARRSGGARISVYVEDEKAVASTPGWVVVLAGRVLPHGGRRFIRAELDEHGARLLARTLPFSRGVDGPLEVREGELGAEARTSLLAAIEAIQPGDLREFGFWTAIDGFPFELALIRRVPFEATVANGNSAGLPPEAKALGALVAALLTAAASAGVMGTTDGTTGEITIGPA